MANFFTSLFGGKKSVEEESIEYQKKMLKAALSGSFKKMEKIEAEHDKWFNSLSEADQQKAAEAAIKWEEGELDSLGDKVKDQL